MAKRSRGSSRARRRPDRGGVPDRFEQLVGRALDGIPEPFAHALDEVAIVIDDEPSPAQRRESGLGPDDDLYGLYEGVPRTEYAADWSFVPNKITLFRVALEEDFPDPAELEHEVRITVIHELAHHMGIDDDRLHDLGVD
jgi:predicted Zn-dependent protease with MMP-like domain